MAGLHRKKKEKSLPISDTQPSVEPIQKPSFRLSKKHKILLIAGLVPILLLIVLLTMLFFTKPTVELGFGLNKPQEVTIQSQLNNTGTYPLLKFEKEHVVTINGERKGIFREYQVTTEDLREGKNDITVQAFRDYNLLKVESSEKNTYTLQVDRVKPAVSIPTAPPKYAQLQKETKVTLQSEPNSKILINKEEKGTMQEAQAELTLPLKDGMNTFEIQTMDTFGNLSDPIKVEVDALVGDSWEAYNCGGIILAYDKNRLQRGFNGIRDPRQDSAAAQQYIAGTQQGRCDLNQKGFGLGLNPTGTKLYCFNCGGEANVSLLSLGRTTDNYLADLDLSQFPNSQKRKEEFTTRSGIKGELLYYELPYQEFEGYSILPSSVYVFVFRHKDQTFYIKTTNFKKEFIAEIEGYFNEVVKNVVVG
jgi:hypothetical protein